MTWQSDRRTSGSASRSPALVLASASPRRRDILAALGVEFEVQVAAVDESQVPGETAADMVLRLARSKALAVAGGLPPGLLVLGADTAVVLDDQVFGKPESGEHAVRMLQALSGRTHTVVTGVAVATQRRVLDALASTRVRFREISPDEIRDYWQSGEPEGKAGAYAIQGLGGCFVEHIEGSYSAVVGLPVFETGKLLQAAGLDLLRPNSGLE